MAGPRGLSGAAVRRGQGGGLIRELGRAYRSPFPAHSPPGFEQEASSPPHLASRIQVTKKEVAVSSGQILRVTP